MHTTGSVNLFSLILLLCPSGCILFLGYKCRSNSLYSMYLTGKRAFASFKICFLSPGYRMCAEPTSPENGYWIGNEFWEGRNVTYRCNKGYWLRGPFVRLCNEIGNWTEEEPTCEGKKASRYILGKLICRPNSLSLITIYCDGMAIFPLILHLILCIQIFQLTSIVSFLSPFRARF